MSRITSASTWLAKVQEVELPSGNVAGLRQVDVFNLIGADGKIPQLLRSSMGEVGKRPAKAPTAEDTLEMAALADRVVKACWVEPPLAPLGDPRVTAGEAITLTHISMQDKMHVLTWAMGGEAAVEAANAFLVTEGERVQPAPGGEDVRPTAE